jgi:primosomal protein N' (replication factor Y)
VAVCVDRPLLALDRPFTYSLGEELEAGVGSLVQVPFHGRNVRGWVLGPTDDVPPRMLPVGKLVSPVRFFDSGMLSLLRWMSERYIAPLASVIARAVPPRVALEELALGPDGGLGPDGALGPAAAAPRASPRPTPAAQPPPAFASLRPLGDRPLLPGYRGGRELLDAISRGSGAFVVRPTPEHEQALAVEAVDAALVAGRTAIVLVPEAEPLPATARAVVDAFGDDVGLFLGGDRRERYRMWLEIRSGRYRCMVGTRPAVFAPVAGLGLVWVARESHPGHREGRSPYYHVRDVALARARLEHAVAVMAALCPTTEVLAAGCPTVLPATRAWPPVEVVRPGPEGRAPRLLAALKQSHRGAFLYQPLPGYGVARVCRACGEPAACALCGGVLRKAGGAVRCAVCGAEGRCANCGAADFGIARGGVERVEEWAAGAVSASTAVRRVRPEGPFDPPVAGAITVGGPEAVKDYGLVGLDLVGILDADLAARRPGLAAQERTLALWMEAAGFARPSGRVIVQATRTGDPAVQALVTGNPERFSRAEAARRERAGFPVGFPVFRVTGPPGLAEAIEATAPATLLTSSAGGETVCLVAVRPEAVSAFGRTIRELAEAGTVARVEAEPHL